MALLSINRCLPLAETSPTKLRRFDTIPLQRGFSRGLLFYMVLQGGGKIYEGIIEVPKRRTSPKIGLVVAVLRIPTFSVGIRSGSGRCRARIPFRPELAGQLLTPSSERGSRLHDSLKGRDLRPSPCPKTAHEPAEADSWSPF